MTSKVAQWQLQALAWICFCCPGPYNALLSLAGGLAESSVAFARTALVSLSFAFCSLLAAAFVPVLGLRCALTLGAAGYAVYVAALWNTAHGAMMLSYARAGARGASVGNFWIIFNMGTTVGGVLEFVLNFGDGAAAHASNGMYAGFLTVMLVGAALAWGVIRDADSVFRAHRKILLALLPLFAYSNWLYAYHSFYNTAGAYATGGYLDDQLRASRGNDSSWLHLSYQQRINMDVVTSESTEPLAALALCYAGIYKGVQATSAAIAWYFRAVEMAPLAQLQINMALCAQQSRGKLVLQVENFVLANKVAVVSIFEKPLEEVTAVGEGDVSALATLAGFYVTAVDEVDNEYSLYISKAKAGYLHRAGHEASNGGSGDPQEPEQFLRKRSDTVERRVLKEEGVFNEIPGMGVEITTERPKGH
ncbi:hypothetical protein PybrP1_003428 [[Pythium] brassicae (nom. inval.)]|nr:hypothetical protein PybrP1_003428 [[Pythium] brassicae (nom. inval.)]